MLLRTLGGLGLEGSGFSRPKPLLLLAYLSLEGPKPRRYLADLFFMGAKDPFNSLSRALSYLRKEAPSAIEADHQKAWAALSCDAAELLSLADKRQFEACVELYEGPFVETLAIELGAELEEWVYGTREYLAGRMREALLQTAEGAASQGNFVGAASHAETAYTLAGAPELEPEHFERVYSLLSVGNSPRAAEVRDEAQGYGIDLLGSSNAAKTQYQPVPPEDPEIPNNLPPPKTSFVGREGELKLIAEQLADPNCRLLTLHGMGGIGKSRLAMQAAFEQLKQGNFKDGVFFVPLDALSSADLIPSSIAEAVGLELQGQEDTLKQVERFIGKKRMLLVLDNFEHLMEGAVLPSDLLQACPSLKLVVTSREVLKLAEEWVKSLEGLRYPLNEVSTFEEGKTYGSVLLFTRRAKEANLNFSLTPDTIIDVTKICKLVAGAPLALELAATWTRLLPIKEVVSEIGRSLDLLTADSRNIPDRHRSIRAVFDHSWKLLQDTEQSVLMGLAVFQGGFTRGAASAVTGASIPLLAELLDRSLLQIGKGARYYQHPLLSQFTKEKLQLQPDLMSQFQTNHQTYYLGFLQNRYADPDKFTEISMELDNILAASDGKNMGSDPKRCVEIMNLLVVGKVGLSYFGSRGHTRQSLALLEEALENAEVLGDLELAHYLASRLGDTLNEQYRDYRNSYTAYNKALTLAQKLKDSYRELILSSLVGTQKFRLNHEDATEYILNVYELAKSREDLRALGVILQHRGYIAYRQENWTEMKRLSSEAIDTITRLGNSSSVGESEVNQRMFFALLNAGKAEFKLESYQESLKKTDRALEIARKSQNEIWEAFVLDDIGEVYHAMKERGLAESYLTRALHLYKKNNLRSFIETITTFLESNGYLQTHELKS